MRHTGLLLSPPCRTGRLGIDMPGQKKSRGDVAVPPPNDHLASTAVRHVGEVSMKYLCLVYSEETALEAMPEGEFWAFSDEHVALDEELKKSGHSIVAEALQPAHAAKTVRVRDGRLSTTDGPFAETKEQLGGIYLIEASDLDEAIQVASRIPSARIGSIEVRPVWELRRHAPRAWRR
jgi:hypothetical protein